nr:uncharacterized protein LOC129484388 [Symphalangus syndactylus]
MALASRSSLLMAGAGGGHGTQHTPLVPQRPLVLPDPSLHVRGAPWLATRQGCAGRHGPGSPPSGLRSGGVRDMLAEESGGRGFSPGPVWLPPPFPSGTSRDWRLGVASQLRWLQQLPHGPSLVRWARERRAGAPPLRLPRPGARPARARALSRRHPRRGRPTGTRAGTLPTQRAQDEESAAAAVRRPAGTEREGRGHLRMGGAGPPSWDPRRASSL